MAVPVSSGLNLKLMRMLNSTEEDRVVTVLTDSSEVPLYFFKIFTDGYFLVGCRWN